MDREESVISVYSSNQPTEPEKVPIPLRVTLTIKETAEYPNIGINKLENLLRAPRCPFVLYVGNKKLVKRREFEKFISESIEI
ncbi:MAG: excisionase [Eubacteriales bacterium]|nr:excisionase [Eubacteriales bacterium]